MINILTTKLPFSIYWIPCDFSPPKGLVTPDLFVSDSTVILCISILPAPDLCFASPGLDLEKQNKHASKQTNKNPCLPNKSYHWAIIKAKLYKFLFSLCLALANT